MNKGCILLFYSLYEIIFFWIKSPAKNNYTLEFADM